MNRRHFIGLFAALALHKAVPKLPSLPTIEPVFRPGTAVPLRDRWLYCSFKLTDAEYALATHSQIPEEYFKEMAHALAREIDRQILLTYID